MTSVVAVVALYIAYVLVFLMLDSPAGRQGRIIIAFFYQKCRNEVTKCISSVLDLSENNKHSNHSIID